LLKKLTRLSWIQSFQGLINNGEFDQDSCHKGFLVGVRTIMELNQNTESDLYNIKT